MDVGDGAFISIVKSWAVRLSNCGGRTCIDVYTSRFKFYSWNQKIKSSAHCALQEQVEILHKTLMKEFMKDVHLRFY